MNRDLLQRVLEVMGCTTDPDSPHYEDQLAAIEALKAELAKPEPAPAGYFVNRGKPIGWTEVPSERIHIGYVVPLYVKEQP